MALLGQDMNLYENTPLNENVSYSIIKGGITNLPDKWHLFMENIKLELII